MNIEEFLSLKDTDLPSVVAGVDGRFTLGDDDVLLAVGSLAEGLGNSRSDLDLLLITPREGASAPAQDSVTFVAGRCVIDVRILSLAGVAGMIARFAAWLTLGWNVTHAVKLTLDERTLLHRLLHGRILHRGRSDQLIPRLPARRDLARLKLHVARQMARTIQVDMAGYREVGDYRSLVFAAQEVAGHAGDALSAAYELTNPLIKWRSRMLDSLPPGWERPLAVRPTGLTAGEYMWCIHRAPRRPDARHALDHALRITTFARAAFMWAENKLLNRTGSQWKRGPWPRMERRRRDSPLPHLDFDVDFHIAGDHVIVARLNEFGETIELSPREFAVALLFDGTTTAREAEASVYGSRRGAGGANAVGHVIARMTEAGFTAPPRRERLPRSRP